MATRKKSKSFMEMIKAAGRSYGADSRTDDGRAYASYLQVGGVHADEKRTDSPAELMALRKKLLTALLTMRDNMRAGDEAAAILDAISLDITRLARITGAGRQQSHDELKAKARLRMQRIRQTAPPTDVA